VKTFKGWLLEKKSKIVTDLSDQEGSEVRVISDIVNLPADVTESKSESATGGLTFCS
jgi:hypothetical protein